MTLSLKAASVLFALALAAPAFAGWDAEETPVTSIKQVKDVTKETPGYSELSDLYENHPIFGTDEAGNFRPNDPLTHAAWAVWLNNALNEISHRVILVQIDLEPAQLKAFGNLLPSSDETNAPKSVTELKDLKPDAPYFKAVESLVERYAVPIADAKKNLNPDAPLTAAELSDILKGPLRYQGPYPKGNAPLTRADVAVYLDKALLHYNLLIDARLEAVKAKK